MRNSERRVRNRCRGAEQRGRWGWCMTRGMGSYRTARRARAIKHVSHSGIEQTRYYKRCRKQKRWNLRDCANMFMARRTRVTSFIEQAVSLCRNLLHGAASFFFLYLNTIPVIKDSHEYLALLSGPLSSSTGVGRICKPDLQK